MVLLFFLCSNNSRTIDGDESLDDQNYSDNNLWINELVLQLFIISFLMLAYTVCDPTIEQEREIAYPYSKLHLHASFVCTVLLDRDLKFGQLHFTEVDHIMHV